MLDSAVVERTIHRKLSALCCPEYSPNILQKQPRIITTTREHALVYYRDGFLSYGRLKNDPSARTLMMATWRFPRFLTMIPLLLLKGR